MCLSGKVPCGNTLHVGHAVNNMYVALLNDSTICVPIAEDFALLADATSFILVHTRQESGKGSVSLCVTEVKVSTYNHPELPELDLTSNT